MIQMVSVRKTLSICLKLVVLAVMNLSSLQEQTIINNKLTVVYLWLFRV